MWSNEDGGTPTPALMAQWGRTTDIEWVYRVEVERQGPPCARHGGVPGARPRDAESSAGAYDGTHPLLQTCTSNNNVCDSKELRR